MKIINLPVVIRLPVVAVGSILTVLVLAAVWPVFLLTGLLFGGPDGAKRVWATLWRETFVSQPTVPQIVVSAWKGRYVQF